MKSCISVIVLVLISSSYCFGVELDIKKALFDKKLVDEINWNKTNKYFKGKPIDTEYFKDSQIHNEYYGTINQSGLDLKLTLIVNAEKNKSNIALYLPTYKEGDTEYCSKNDINTILDSLKSFYGGSYVQYISKMQVTEDVHFVFNKYQWSTKNTRIVYDVMSIVKKGVENYMITSVKYDSINNVKLYEPVKFIECSFYATFSDGDKGKPIDMTLGIDYNTNKILTDNYFESIYKIDGDFITGKADKDDFTRTIKINRTSGKLTGDSKYKNLKGTYSGSCTILSDKKMF